MSTPVNLPGIEGRMGILPNHSALLTVLDFGEVYVRKDGVEFSPLAAVLPKFSRQGDRLGGFGRTCRRNQSPNVLRQPATVPNKSCGKVSRKTPPAMHKSKRRCVVRKSALMSAANAAAPCAAIRRRQRRVDRRQITRAFLHFANCHRPGNRQRPRLRRWSRRGDRGAVRRRHSG